jgi:small-conductance mechanosensitive channel
MDEILNAKFWVFLYRMMRMPFVQNLFYSLITLCILLLLRYLIFRAILGSKRLPVESKRIWSIRLRNTVILLFFFAVWAIWSNEIKTVAFSIAAIIASLTLALKEVLLGFCGTFIKSISHGFSHGDRIEIIGVRGDVIDQTLLTTTILEVGPKDLTHQYTSRSVVIPNWLFAMHPLINETFFHDFVLHTFVVPSTLLTWKEDETALLESCKIECKQYIEQAQKEMDKKTLKKQLESMSVGPRIVIKPRSRNEIDLIARIAVPLQFKTRIENAIVKRYLEAIAISL